MFAKVFYAERRFGNSYATYAALVRLGTKVGLGYQLLRRCNTADGCDEWIFAAVYEFGKDGVGILCMCAKNIQRNLILLSYEEHE